MQELPPLLQSAIVHALVHYSCTAHDLKEATQNLSIAYRQRNFKAALLNFEQILSYIAVRLPATFTVIQHVMQMVPNEDIYTLLDLGAGPGSVLWASYPHFRNLKKAILIEQHPQMLELGQRLAQTVAPVDLALEWRQESFINKELPSADLVTMSYSLGEVPRAEHKDLLKKVFQAAQKFIVLIEPGTPHGFKILKEARDQLLSLGGHMVAPCTHNQNCPLDEKDWCHFTARFQRSSLHRTAKEAFMGFEDEKYSYLIISKEKQPLKNMSRIIKMPRKHSGHMNLDVCHDKGLENLTYTRKNGPLYKLARHSKWGDLWQTQEQLLSFNDKENDDDD